MPKSGLNTSRMVRFLILFGLTVLVGFSLLFVPFTQPAVQRFSTSIVSAAAVLIRTFGGRATAFSDILENPTSRFEIRMANGCNGVNVTILLWAAILAFPATWAQKGKGLLAGTVAIHSVNMVRFISLYYLGQFNQRWFDFAHEYLWESLMMLDTLVVFWTWAYFVQKSGTVAHARAQ